jgi:inosine-uridine nucleoside N-ribohydrolase
MLNGKLYSTRYTLLADTWIEKKKKSLVDCVFHFHITVHDNHVLMDNDGMQFHDNLACFVVFEIHLELITRSSVLTMIVLSRKLQHSYRKFKLGEKVIVFFRKNWIELQEGRD